MITTRASNGAVNSINRTRTTWAAMTNVTFDPVSTAIASTAYTPPGLVAR